MTTGNFLGDKSPNFNVTVLPLSKENDQTNLLDLK